MQVFALLWQDKCPGVGHSHVGYFLCVSHTHAKTILAFHFTAVPTQVTIFFLVFQQLKDVNTEHCQLRYIQTERLSAFQCQSFLQEMKERM